MKNVCYDLHEAWWLYVGFLFLCRCCVGVLVFVLFCVRLLLLFCLLVCFCCSVLFLFSFSFVCLFILCFLFVSFFFLNAGSKLCFSCFVVVVFVVVLLGFFGVFLVVVVFVCVSGYVLYVCGVCVCVCVGGGDCCCCCCCCCCFLLLLFLCFFLFFASFFNNAVFEWRPVLITYHHNRPQCSRGGIKMFADAAITKVAGFRARDRPGDWGIPSKSFVQVTKTYSHPRSSQRPVWAAAERGVSGCDRQKLWVPVSWRGRGISRLNAAANWEERFSAPLF